MASARPALLRRPPRAPGKRGFAKRALDFAKRAPGFPMLWIGTLAAAGVMIVTGGFGTGAMPLHQRAPFWLLLMLWSAIKWQLWFLATVRRPRDWTRAALLGAVLLSLPLPLELWLSARAVGLSAAFPSVFGTWGRALAIGAVLFFTLLLALHATGHRPIFRRAARATSDAEGLLHRAGVTPESLVAIEAEDHYCRVRRRDGSNALIHYRFGDALDEVADLEGAQIHRGAWVAADAISGAAREGRRWHLMLTDGSKVAVSATHLAKVRARGWLIR